MTAPWDDPTTDPLVAIQTVLMHAQGEQQRLKAEVDRTEIAWLNEAIGGVAYDTAAGPTVEGIHADSKKIEIKLNDVVARWLPAYIAQARFRYRNEYELHRGLDQVLTTAGLEARLEVRLADGERIDFLIGMIGIEVKVRGSTPRVADQLARYAATGKLRHLILVTSRAKHRSLDGIALDAPGGKVLVRNARLPWL